MPATTIKLDGNILRELKTYIGRGQTLTAFVRQVLESEIRRQKMARAGRDYADFLKSNPEEETWMKEWEAADLEIPPKASRKGKLS